MSVVSTSSNANLLKQFWNNVFLHELSKTLFVILYVKEDEITYMYENGKEFNFMNTEKFGALTLEVMEKSTNCYGVLIIFKSKKDMDIKSICHESSHAAKFLFKHIGADVEEHEPF